MFVAKFAASGADSDVFAAPTFNTSGGGTANIQYNSDSIEQSQISWWSLRVGHTRILIISDLRFQI
jgi:hypothetical protein